MKLNHYPKKIVAGTVLGVCVFLLPTAGEARHLGTNPDLETKVGVQRTINIGESRNIGRQVPGTSTLESRVDAILHPAASEPAERHPVTAPVPATVSAYDSSIIGTPLASQQQCVDYLLSVNPTPNITVTPQELVSYYYEEGSREGIRPDVAFAQALKETGFFRYGGTVTPDQNNYCGLGTTSSQVKGAYFDSAKLGVRAQIQHLLAYASTRRPAEPVVDPRYSLVRSSYGSQTLGTWDDLNGRWAVPGYSYGQSIMSIFRAMLMK
ncbi:MAG: glucosaminidase domain-containing protein [Selenomonas sp.]|nr:glucosaminidase domain-containing protein [Selenomonas sp.]